MIVGATVEEAVFKAILLEKACRAMLTALAVQPYDWSFDGRRRCEATTGYHPKNILSGWSYFCRKLERWDGVPTYID